MALMSRSFCIMCEEARKIGERLYGDDYADHLSEIGKYQNFWFQKIPYNGSVDDNEYARAYWSTITETIIASLNQKEDIYKDIR